MPGCLDDWALVLFPEGALSQANDHLNELQEGVSFIARSAAAKLEKTTVESSSSPRKVYTVPVAFRHVYEGDIEATAGAMLSSIEKRLSWKTQEGQCLVERIYRVGNALLSLKELEYLGQSHTGELDERLTRLIDHLLTPLETEWLGGAKEGAVILRVKELRRAILPAMIDGMASGLHFMRNRVELLVPLGASLMRPGAVTYFVCATLFIADLYGRSISMGELGLLVVNLLVLLVV